MPQTFVKASDEDLDYEFDFAARTNGITGAASDYLESGETITDYEVESDDDDLAVGDTALTKGDTCVQTWLSGGTVDTTYRVTATITTSLDRTAVRTIKIRVLSR